MSGTISLPTGTGVNTPASVSDAVNTALNTKAPLANPIFTGAPSAPTAASGTNTTQIATTAFVQSAVSGSTGGAGPGIISVKQAPYNAKGDGVTNDTAAITAADAAARAAGAALYFPGGIYMVSQLVVYTGSNWWGDGRQTTIIKQIIGSNTDLVYGVNSNANYAATNQSQLTAFPNGFELHRLTLNGNWNNGSGNTSGSGLSAFCARPIIEDVFITNCAEYGMRTAYLDSATLGGWDTFAMEGYFSNIKVDTVGKHGWWFNGPHDSNAYSVIVIDAGQAAANTYNAFHFTNSSGWFGGLHGWVRNGSGGAPSGVPSSLLLANSLYASGGHYAFFGACNFEGAQTHCVYISGATLNLDSTTQYYGLNGGGSCIYIDGNSSLSSIEGTIGAPSAKSGTPACSGLQFASSGNISGTKIDLIINSNEAGNVIFGAGDVGGNTINVVASNSTSATFVGAPHSATLFKITGTNSNGVYTINENYTSFGDSNTSISLSDGTLANIVAQPLSAGTWEIWGQVAINCSGTITQLSGHISTSATTQGYGSSGTSFTQYVNAAGMYSAPAGHTIMTLTTASTIYLNMEAVFSGSATGGGYIACKRL